MIRWRRGEVVAVRREWPGAVEADVRCDGTTLRALAYPALVGRPEPGDAVLLNTTALELGLGTGGYALVVALPDRLPADAPPSPGHIVKARYTPLQATVLAVDEQDSPHHDLLAGLGPLPAPGMPVVVADLHSALPAVVAGVRAARPAARVAYVMTDGAALPLWLSRTVAGLHDVLAGTVTVGQAFGGDLEAVTLHTGLLAAALVLRADVAVVTQGPGNVGTGTAWGFSGVAAGEAVNAAVAVGARPVGSLRISTADARDRHRGVSHHSTTAYGRVALGTADVVVPVLDDADLLAEVRADCAPLAERHRLVDVPVGGLLDALRASPVGLSTMGRGLDEEEAYFLAAAAAGRHAASLLA